MPRCHVRCSHCTARRCLRRHPDRYERLPACRQCGRRRYRVDRWMNRRNTTHTRCDCAGYWFPHRRGSLFCWHRADGSNRYPGDADFADRNFDGLAA
ncbi:hypothetical protein WI73_04695 [Burkholderia ubonensis]|nr:hypothetical protein WI73_04695 [Burkholderia ubonensis]